MASIDERGVAGRATNSSLAVTRWNRLLRENLGPLRAGVRLRHAKAVNVNESLERDPAVVGFSGRTHTFYGTLGYSLELAPFVAIMRSGSGSASTGMPIGTASSTAANVAMDCPIGMACMTA